MKILGLDGRLQYINGNGCALMELPAPEAILGAEWTSFWPELHRSEIEQALARAAEGKPQRLEAPCPTAAGTPKIWDVVLAPLPGACRATSAVLVTFRDITSWRQAQQQLEQTAAALRSAGEVAKIGGWEIDCATGAVTWAAETWALLRGTPRPIELEEALNIYPPRDRQRLEEAFETARTRGEPFKLDAAVIRFDGSETVARIFGEPVFEQGLCVRLRGAAQDVADEVTAEERRQSAERRLALAAELAQVHVFEVDYEHGVLSKGGRKTPSLRSRSRSLT